MSAMDEVMAQMFGYSVTQRIKQVDQPKGGYIKPKEFKAEFLGEGGGGIESGRECQPDSDRIGGGLYDALYVWGVG